MKQKACFSYHDVIHWRGFSSQILSKSRSEHQTPLVVHSDSVCALLLLLNRMMLLWWLGWIRAGEVTEGDVSHGSSH